jgi:hypothetical protein
MLAENDGLKLLQLETELLLRMNSYSLALQENKCFEEVKKLYVKIKQAEKEYKAVIDKHPAKTVELISRF